MAPSILVLLSLQPDTFAAGDHTRSLSLGDLKRSYLVHVPKSYDGTKPFPVVLAFHGGGSTAQGMVRFSGLNQTADKHGFIVVYPSGTGSMEQRLTFNGGNCCGYAMTNKIDDVAFTRALLDDLAKLVKVDAKRVYSTGMSNGAILSYLLASELSDRIAAIAPVSGLMGTEKCAPKRPVPVIHFHGTDDQFAPFNGGDSKIVLTVKNLYSVDHGIKAWLKANGCREEPTAVEIPDNAKDGTKATRTTYGGGKDGAEVVLVAIEGMGHAWPGQPGVKALGKSTRNVSANEMMWAFFQNHPMK